MRNMAYGGAALAFLGWAAFRALAEAIDLPTLHLDGAFQAASGLFRLDAGQFPGRDFFPYLGIGPLLVLYPAFKAFGSNLAASVVAAHFMTVVLCGLSVAILWHLVFRPASFITSVVAGACFFAVLGALAIAFSIHPDDALGFVSGPGVSLRPIRAAAPYLMAAVYYFFILDRGSAQRRGVLGGVATGAVLLWSNDFAIPTAALFAVLFALGSSSGNEPVWRRVVLFSASAGATWFALLGLATLGHPMEMLGYNFRDVAGDQWWYFAPYSESSRLFGPQHVFRLVTQENVLPLVVLALAAVVAARTRRIEHVLVAWIGCVLFLGGVVACVGGHVGRYFSGFHLWGVTTGAFALLAWSRPAMARAVGRRGGAPVALGLFFTAIPLFLLLAMAVLGWQEYRSKLDRARSDTRRFLVPELGGYLRAEWIEYVELARRTDTRQVVEEYWGVWSALRGIVPAWPVDSAIHALGATRQAARAALGSAKVIISTRYATSGEWQPWSLSQNFWFYDELLRNWTPRELSPTTIVWGRNEIVRREEDIACRTQGNGSSVVLDVPRPGFYRLEFDYRFSASGRRVVLVRNNLSVGADSDGYVSIDPRGSKASFPVYVSGSGQAVLDSKVVGGGRHELAISACAASAISLVDDEVLHVPGSIGDSFYLTDDVWSQGVARDWAGFFVPNTEESSAEFRIGRVVTLSDGDTRTIVRVEPFGRYLNVYLEGNPLNPRKAGLPSAYSVSDGDPFYLTDRNWSRGVSRHWAGFFQPNTEEFIREYRPGRVVTLADGEKRRIVRVDPQGPYLHVFLEGAVLKPSSAGMPSSYSVRLEEPN